MELHQKVYEIEGKNLTEKIIGRLCLIVNEQFTSITLESCFKKFEYRSKSIKGHSILEKINTDSYVLKINKEEFIVKLYDPKTKDVYHIKKVSKPIVIGNDINLEKEELSKMASPILYHSDYVIDVSTEQTVDDGIHISVPSEEGVASESEQSGEAEPEEGVKPFHPDGSEAGSPEEEPTGEASPGVNEDEHSEDGESNDLDSTEGVPENAEYNKLKKSYIIESGYKEYTLDNYSLVYKEEEAPGLVKIEDEENFTSLEIEEIENNGKTVLFMFFEGTENQKRYLYLDIDNNTIKLINR